MLETVAGFGGKIVDALPGFVIRLLFTPDQVSRAIKIEPLIDRDTIMRDAARQVPFVHLIFKIDNSSRFSLVLDRLLIQVWFGQPTLFDGVILQRHSMLPRKSGQHISLRYALTSGQRQQIEQFYRDFYWSEPQIEYIAYFESKVGLIQKSNRWHVIRLRGVSE